MSGRRGWSGNWIWNIKWENMVFKKLINQLKKEDKEVEGLIRKKKVSGSGRGSREKNGST